MKTLLGFLFAIHMSVVGVGLPQDSCKSTVVGDLRIEHFQSKTFGRMITVRVWLPPDYNDATQATKKFPTLYMLDGQNAFDQCTAFKGEQELRIDETVTRLIADHTIASMIVVGIDSAHGKGRDHEYEVWKDTLTDGNQKEPDITAFSRYRIADASIVPLLANATLTRQHLKAMLFHETYQHMPPYVVDYIRQRTTQMGSRWRNYYCHGRL